LWNFKVSDEENEQVEVRRQKLKTLREKWAWDYPNDFKPDSTTAEIVARFADAAAEELEQSAAKPALAGRLVAIRRFGKAAFALLQDGSGRLQIYFKHDRLGEESFEIVRLLDLGDLVGVRGRLFRTKTGELTVEVEELRLLVKALRPLPEKWHGLQDVETRYRQRYLDLIVNPRVRRIFEVRARVLSEIRAFLAHRGFIEVETPMMQAVPGGALARPFVTHHNTLDIDLYLRVAPELYLKRLVVGGFERVYELNRCFRNEGVSTEHNPEFTMLELYQAYATHEDLMVLTEELFTTLAMSVAGSLRLKWGDHAIDLTPPWRRLTLRQAISEATGVAPAELEDVAALRRIARDRAIPQWESAPAGWLLAELFEKFVEEKLVGPTFVRDYPVEVSPLARRRSGAPAEVDRFELFIGGRELANAFCELNDPDDQRQRFLAQLEARRKGDEEAHAMDEDYILALEYGLAPTAGAGVGIDRLVMLLTDSPSIRDVILFPQLRPPSR